MNVIKTLTDQTNTVIRYGRRNAPTVLTLLGVCGFVAAVVKTAQSADKAVEAKKKLEKKITEETPTTEKVVETVKAYAPVYGPVLILGTASAVCIFSANHINNKRLAAVTAAYSLCDTNFKEYRNKVIEKFGEKKDQAVIDEIAQDKVTNNPVEDVIQAYTGDTLFMDGVTKQYFRSNREYVLRKLMEFKNLLFIETFLSHNDWIDTLDDPNLKHVSYGDNIGYNSTNNIDIYFSVTEASNGEPCTVIEYRTPPTYDIYM